MANIAIGRIAEKARKPATMAVKWDELLQTSRRKGIQHLSASLYASGVTSVFRLLSTAARLHYAQR
jgi:hypothetical protein